MFNFAYPTHLYLLAAVPLLALLFVAARYSRRAKLRRFGRLDVVDKMMPDASRYTPAVRIVLQCLALAMLVIAVARPRTEGTVKQETAAGIEIVVAFDLSNSMLASSTDRDRDATRLDRAKVVLERLFDRLENDKVGLVIFAGTSKVQLPVTSDFYTANMYLGELHPSMMAYQGTDIASSIRMAMNCFSGTEDMRKAIILITDSEDHEGEAVEAARLAAENGIQVDVLGVGTPSGATVPGITDENGQPVHSALNENLAKEIANAGNGIYVNAAASSSLNELASHLETLQKSEFDTVVYSAAAEQFPTFAALALILLIIDIFVVDRKISWLKGIEFFSTKTIRQSRNTKDKKK